jgi:hypothetical protein
MTWGVACTHLHHESPNNTAVLNITQPVNFIDYLEGSAIPDKKTCEISPGSYDLYAKPWAVAGGKWLFINIKEAPEGCGFWQGFVQATKVQLPNGSLLDPKTLEHNQRNILINKRMTQVSRPQPASGSKGDLLMATYGQPKGYSTVEDHVLNWYGQKKEGCVAFASTALRMIGEPVPVADLRGDDAISIVTKPFVDHLINVLGYTRIDNLAEAKPGDIGVTVGDKVAPDYPTHVYLFAEWDSQEKLLARVIDNQGFRHLRPLLASQEARFADKDPTAYFLRP